MRGTQRRNWRQTMKGTTGHEEAEREKYTYIYIYKRKGGMKEKRQGRQTRAGLN